MNIGFTIGKFAPLHKGHELLIEKGIKEDDEFYVLINDTNVTNIPLKTRANWIKTMFPKAYVILGENPPKQYGMDEESIKIQTDYLKNIFKNIPVNRFYSSEEYGKFVARDMNIEEVKVEKKIPICGSIIRNNIIENKKYIENIVYQDIVK